MLEGALDDGCRLRSNSTGAALWAALLLLVATLLWRLQAILAFSLWAIRFPYEIDYGEGIVWEQMRRIVDGQGYGQIADLPGIVFHYPPVYHLTSYALAAITGMDQLAAGRTISLAALAFVAGAGAAVVTHVLRRQAATVKWLGAIGAVCTMASCWPIVAWTPVMRVDMLAIALSFAGLSFAIAAVNRPLMVHAAAICFVAALFTKQTMVAAPAACFLLLLLLRPRTALPGIGTSLFLGLAALATLQWTTGGGFVRHILVGNLNRLELYGLTKILTLLAAHLIYVAIGMVALWPRLSEIVRYLRADGGKAVRNRLVQDPGRCAFLFVAGYFLASTPMLLLFAKSGANSNYALEWFFLLSLLIGIGLADATAKAQALDRKFLNRATFLTLAAAFQALILPSTTSDQIEARRPTADTEALSSMIRASRKPVVSDDMVILLRSGKDVVWESAIFAELASVGRYDERPILRAIEERRFGFFVTFRDRGDKTFDARYTPRVADAMARAYPVKRHIAGLTIHLPAPCAAERATPSCP